MRRFKNILKGIHPACGKSPQFQFSQVTNHIPGTISTIFTISGIFFLYNFLVRDPGKWCTCVRLVKRDITSSAQ